MNSAFCNLANSDQELITLMKNTIEFQKTVMKKRESLVKAITHNVKYLADVHRKNNCSLRETKEHNEWLVIEN